MFNKAEVDFSINLLKILKTTEKPIVFSPISILNVLAAIFTGSDGVTSNELAHILDEDQINGDLLMKCITRQDAGEIQVSIPIFKTENKILLNESLKNLGITQIFDRHGIRKMFNQPQYVERIIHSTKIEIDQYGTKAAAATVAEIGPCISTTRSYRRTFIAGHPFIYFVTLVENNVNELKNILIMGIYC